MRRHIESWLGKLGQQRLGLKDLVARGANKYEQCRVEQSQEKKSRDWHRKEFEKLVNKSNDLVMDLECWASL